MNIYYDFEFLEDGPLSPVLPISLGMVRDDGPEFYGIVKNIGTISLAARHPWLRENVIPALPVRLTGRSPLGCTWDKDHPDYQHAMIRAQLAEEVRQFITSAPDPQLYGWYCAYDHVLLAQLFGKMTDLPPGVPMHTCDLKQDADRFGARLPQMPGITEHHALSDAREIRWRYHWLMNDQLGAGPGSSSCPCETGCTLT